MANKLCIVFLCLASILLVQSHAEIENRGPAPTLASPASTNNSTNVPMHGTTGGSLKPEECDPRCQDRCSNTQYKKPCLFFCKKCCATCLCVPPGTYGNKEVCPCYNNWKTKRGGPKCP